LPESAEQTSVTFDTLAEVQPPLIKLAPGLVHRLKPDRLSALVRRLRSSNTEVIVSGIDNPALIGAVWASGACYAQGTFIQAAQSDPSFDLSDVGLGG
jgi:EAL domain-containing protein (putative c-di-GMP-specific phosphodiesterase class I)